METVLISGGSGLVGKALTQHLAAKGYRVIILTRGEKHETIDEQGHAISYAHWDIVKKTIDLKAVQAADYIIHLAGAGVMDRSWTETYKKEIVASRAESARLIYRTLQKNPNKVKAVISASAIGWYGADKEPGKKFSETDPSDQGFLGETCRLWEAGIEPVQQLGKRVVILRTGIVLSKEGGALEEFKKPLNTGIAGIIGDGTQVMSWIHMADLCRLYTEAIENENMSGVYNAVAPQPATNKELITALAKKIRGRFYIPVHVPKFLLKLLLGQRSIEVLKSTTVEPFRLKEAGFTFLFPSVEAALNDLCG